MLVECVSESLQLQQSFKLMFDDIFILIECILTTRTFFTSDSLFYEFFYDELMSCSFFEAYSNIMFETDYRFSYIA